MNAIDKAIELLNIAIDNQGKDRLDNIHRARNVLKQADTVCISRQELEAMRLNELEYGYGEGENFAEGFNDCINKLLER